MLAAVNLHQFANAVAPPPPLVDAFALLAITPQPVSAIIHFRKVSLENDRKRRDAEAEANRWLKRCIAQYNAQQHRAEAHSRIEDGLKNLPADGVREMCGWERFCAF